MAHHQVRVEAHDSIDEQLVIGGAHDNGQPPVICKVNRVSKERLALFILHSSHTAVAVGSETPYLASRLSVRRKTMSWERTSSSRRRNCASSLLMVSQPSPFTTSTIVVYVYVCMLFSSNINKNNNWENLY